MVPSPSSPKLLIPQHRTVPVDRCAQPWSLPATMPVAVVTLKTGTGLVEGVAVPFPSWPKPLAPQQDTVPLSKSAQLW